MSDTTITLIASLRREITPLLERIPHVRRTVIDGFPLYCFAWADRDCRLIESGMGVARAAAATKAVIAATRPQIILNFGFAGAACADPAIGDIVVAEKILRHQHEGIFTDESGLSADLAKRTTERLMSMAERPFDVFRGTAITTAEVAAKRDLASYLPAGTLHPVLEMETAAVARVAARNEVPMVAIRAISDGFDDKLAFSVRDFTDSDMNLRLWKVLLSAARRPGIVPQLAGLAAKTRLAGANLAIAVTEVLETVGR